MLVLGIESSCDDTSVALVDCSDKGHVIIAEKTASQIDVHAKYGGVVPEIAGRMHAEKIVPLIESVFAEATTDKGSDLKKPDVIAVTAGPGLITGLIVGVEAARTLSYAWDVPLVAVNHIAGHIHSVEIRNSKLETGDNLTTPYTLHPTPSIQFPALALVVSGGHTELIEMQSHTNFKIIGRTKDDAAGECFDKVAKLLGFPYPGGPHISKQAQTGKTDAILFPRPMLKEENYEFSFAGLKTAALYWLRDNKFGALADHPWKLPAGVFGQTPGEPTIHDFCASFEQAIVDVLVTKTVRAAEKIKPKSIILAGGVAANKKLRETLREAIAEQLPHSTLLIPELRYCMDNGAMIAVAGFYRAFKKEWTACTQVPVNPNWRVDHTI